MEFLLFSYQRPHVMHFRYTTKFSVQSELTKFHIDICLSKVLVKFFMNEFSGLSAS